MGNSQSGSVEEHSDLDSVYQNVERERVEGDHKILTSTTGNHRINYDTRQHMRSKLFGCSAEELGLPIQRSNDATPDLAANASNATSTNIDIKTHSRSPSNVDMREVISILREIKKSASPNELIELHKALMPSGKDVVLPTASEPAVETKRSKIEALIRRRSSLAPGIATREHIAKGNQPTSPSSQSQIQPWSADMFGQSPLSRLAGWESKNNGLSERAITPDINYLGIHQLGSLRVTNGAVSPTTRQSMASVKHEDEYFTASEGSGRDSPEKWLAKARYSHGATESLEDLAATPKQALSPNADVWASVQEFPFYNLDQSCNLEHESFGPGETSLERTGSVLRPYHKEANSNPFLADDAIEHPPLTYRDMNDSSYPPRIPSAVLYQTEANSNPFLPLKDDADYPCDDSSVSTEDTEINYKMLNESFLNRVEESIDCEMTSNFGKSPRTVYRSDAYNRLNGYEESPSAASSIYTAGSRKEKREKMERPKTDSGYHSESSLRPLRELGVLEEQSVLLRSVLRSSQGTGRDGSTFKDDRDYRTPPSSDRFQYNRRPASIPYETTATGLSPQTEQNPTLPRLMPPKATSSSAVPIITPAAQSLPANKALSSRPSTQLQRESTVIKTPILKRVKSTPLFSSDQDKKQQRQGPKKLQKKKRPLSDRLTSQPVVVQSRSKLGTNVSELPQIPVEVVSRYSRRMSQHPDMEHLERTFKSVSHCDPRDSIASFEPFNLQNIRFPSPTRSPELGSGSRKGLAWRRQSLGTERHIRDIFRSKSRSTEENSNSTNKDSQPEPIPTGLSDFGTVASSIGSSPYDLASSVGNRTPSLRSVHGPRQMTHPHQMSSNQMSSNQMSSNQMSSNVPRVKSIIGMSDKDASAFAMQRSRDRSEYFGATMHDQHRWDQADVGNRDSRAISGQHGRSQSFHAPLHPDKGYQPANARRKSMHETMVAGPQHRRMAHARSEDMNAHERHQDGNYTESNHEAKNHAQLENIDSSWNTHARAWRQHRKSIGENLLRDEYLAGEQGEMVRPRGRPQTHTRSAPQTPAKPRQSGGWETSQKHRRQRQSPPKRDPPMVPVSQRITREDAPVRTSSPTPSVLERAAAYERNVDSQPASARPSPTRQPRSLLKSSPADAPSSRNANLSAAVNRASAFGSIMPSGVGSAYTSSQRSSPSKSPPAPGVLPKLSAPRQRPWPTSAHAASDLMTTR